MRIFGVCKTWNCFTLCLHAGGKSRVNAWSHLKCPSGETLRDGELCL